MLDPKPLKRGASISSPNKQKEIKNSLSSATLCTTKLWHATLQTLPLPTRNRIVLQEQQQQQENSTISNLFRRLTRNSTLKRSNRRRSSITIEERPSWLCKKGNNIFLKSPYVVAGGELIGSVVIQTSDHILSGFQSLCINLIGIEVIADPNNLSQIIHTHQFLKSKHILIGKKSLNNNSNKFNLPFTIPLDNQLGGTFHDKRGSVKYYLESEITHSISDNAEETTSKYVTATRAVTIYPNCVIKSLADIHLYTQQSQSIQIWKHFSSGQYVFVDTSIPRTIWVAGASIYLTLKLRTTKDHSISDIKVELKRKQHTFSNSTMLEKSALPLTSTCEIVAQVALSKMNWWQPLHVETDDEQVIILESPSEQVTINNQKLIDVSYTIHVSLSCPEITTVVAEFPVTLVHPISMDPPPGNYTTSKSTNSPSHLFLQKNFQRKEEEQTIDSPTVSFLPLDMETSSIVKMRHDSYRHSCSNSYFTDTEEASRKSSYISASIFEESSIYSVDTLVSSTKKTSHRNPLNKMQRSLSDWRTHVSMKMLPKQQTVLSPSIVVSDRVPVESPRSSLLSGTPGSICSSLTDDRSSERFFLRCSNRMMRFGQIKDGPKQFGQQHLGDASSEIKRHYAENLKESLSVVTDPLEEDCYHYGDDEDTEATQNKMTRKKKNYKNSLVSLDSLDSSNQEYEINSIDVPENHSRPRYPLSHTNSGTKRMLAFSRYLKNIQRKSMQQPINNCSRFKR